MAHIGIELKAQYFIVKAQFSYEIKHFDLNSNVEVLNLYQKLHKTLGQNKKVNMRSNTFELIHTLRRINKVIVLTTRAYKLFVG